MTTEERLRTLTKREMEVLHLVYQGRLNKQIARALGVCDKTVEAHRHSIMEKMGHNSIVQLTRAVYPFLEQGVAP